MRLHYAGVWWNGSPAHFDNTNDGGPDPIAQGATLVTVTAGRHLTGYDRCFGCDAIVISSITPGRTSLTVAFTTPGFVIDASVQNGASKASALIYTVTCSPSDGTASGSANGTSSPITVTGLTSRAPYTCVVVASDGRTTVGRSAVSNRVLLATGPVPGTEIVDPVPAVPVPGELPRTGTSSETLTYAAFLILILGLGLFASTRREVFGPRGTASYAAPHPDRDRARNIAELRALVTAARRSAETRQ